MTELQAAPQRPERLTTARALPVRSPQRATQTGKPGHASKIITAGLSTSLVLGIVSYLGNAAKVEARQQAQEQLLAAAQALQTTVVPAVATPATTVSVAAVPGAAAPAAAAPVVTAAATPVAAAPAAPQVIAIAVPVPPPPVAAAPQPAAPSSGTTTASG